MSVSERPQRAQSGPTVWLTRTQVGLAVGMLLVSLVVVADLVFRDDRVPFLTRVDDPMWITPLQVAFTGAIPVDRSQVPVVSFAKVFDVNAVPDRATAQIRALRLAELWINGTRVWHSPSGNDWKRTVEQDVTAWLRPGSNEVQVRVANPSGPPLVQLRIEDAKGESLVESDETWGVVDSWSRRIRSTRATDTRPDRQSFEEPSTFQVVLRRAPVLMALFACGALSWLARARFPGHLCSLAPGIVLAVATAFWVAVYAFKSASLPVRIGFDIRGHLEYIDLLITRAALPTATDGWSTYHPPLGHAIIAGLVAPFDLDTADDAARWLYRLPTFLAGLASVWATFFTARHLFPGSPLRVSLATGFTALLPMNLYMSAYVSNEPIHSAWVSVALAMACGLLVRRGAPPLRLASLVLALGAAVLTKFTALVAVPLVALAQTVKMALMDRTSWARATATGAALLAGVAAIGGWYYGRNWRLFGRPLVGNWDLPGERGWWSQPGFHTADYYTSFGQSLFHPFFAGYASFWDGIYSTLWGDGLVGGLTRIAGRHGAWNYEFMTATYLLALPATLLIAVGYVRGLRLCLRGDLGARLAMSLLLGFLYVACFALFAITLRLPFYSQAKAFYVLAAVLPLAVVAGLGLAWPLERLRGRYPVLGMVYAGWLACLAGTIVLAFLA